MQNLYPGVSRVCPAHKLTVMPGADLCAEGAVYLPGQENDQKRSGQ